MSSGLIELHLADGLGAFDQLVDGTAEEAAGEINDEEADEGDFHGGDEEDAEFHGGDFVVHAFEVEAQVEDAEHLHLRRMGVALRLAAGRLVVDGGGHGEAAAAIGSAEDAHAVRQVGRIAVRRGLGGTRLVLRIGGEHHMAGAIEHAYAVDALFEGDGLHDFVGGLAVVVQHGVPGGAGDGFGELIGAEEDGVEELPLFGCYVDESGNRRHNDHDDGDREHQLPGEAPGHGI